MTPAVEYFNHTRAALTLSACAQGLIKSGVYGFQAATVRKPTVAL